MSRFTVVWSPGTLNQLTTIWLSADDRQAVTAAADAVDKQLADAPADNGVEVAEGLWKIRVPPLLVFFEIHEEDCLVKVTRVKVLPPGPSGSRNGSP